MSIKRVTLPSGTERYEVRVCVGTRWHRQRCKTREEAKRREAELKAMASDLSAKMRLDLHRRDMGFPDIREKTLNSLVHDVMDSSEFLSRSEASRSIDETAWDAMVKFFGEDCLVHTITTDRLEALRETFLLSKKPAKKTKADEEQGEDPDQAQEPVYRSAATVNRLMTPIKSILQRAYRLGYAPSNPAARLASLPTDPPPERVLTQREEEALLKGIHVVEKRTVDRQRRGPMPLTIPNVPPEHREDMEEWIVFLLDTGARTFSEVGAV
ncbi:MAG: hypothetical protein JXA57_09755, partial [Armatimonadetes bacterium]|nr:hypothetical protein [Armatimonadota bacterium]